MKKMGITAKFYVWIVICILSLIPAVVVNTAFGYLPSLTMLFMGIISLAWLLVLNKCMECTGSNENVKCQRKSMVDFGLKLVNKSIFAVPRIEIGFSVTGKGSGELKNQDAVLSMRGKEERKLSYNIKFDHIGLYTLRIREIVVYDLLGLWKFSFDNNETYSAEVFPNVENRETLELTENSMSDSMHANVQSKINGMDYTGIREYTYGDTIKSIHWKLSAHLSGMVTKMMETYTNSGVSVVLDLRVSEYGTETKLSLIDAVTEEAVSVGGYASERGIDNDVIYMLDSGEIKSIVPKSYRRLEGIVEEWIPYSSENESVNTEKILRKILHTSYGFTNIVLCTSYISEETISLLMNIKRMGKMPMVFFIIPGDVFDRELEALLRPLKDLEYGQIPYSVVTAEVTGAA